MHPDYENGVNAEDEVADPNSVFHYWASVLTARKKFKEVLVYGEFKLLDRENPDIFAFERRSGNEKVVVACNFTQEEQRWFIENFERAAGVVLSTHGRANDYFQGNEIVLQPFEAWAISL